MNTTLEEIRIWVKNNIDNNQISIKGLWDIKCLFQPSILERKFNHHILIAQTIAQGACYYEGDRINENYLHDLVGCNYDCCSTNNDYIDIALLDSIAMSFNFSPNTSYDLNGTNSSKAFIRSNILVDEINLILKETIKNNIKVCNIGVVSLVINELLKQGYTVSACDKDKKVIGKTLFDKVIVKSHKFTLEEIKNSDIALVTGMVLATNSLEEIISTAENHNTKLVIFAETGAGFAPFYINNKNIDIVISEPFPFYTFNGHTQINIFRKIDET